METFTMSRKELPRAGLVAVALAGRISNRDGAAAQLAGRQAPTHLGRVLQDLGIGYVQARSPQGKGRVERLWGTLQDRLVSELRLHGIATREAANAFLPMFRDDFNRRFARAAGTAPAVWRQIGRASCRVRG